MANKLWIQDATDKMKKKGTLGKFGKATPKKIAKGKKLGGLDEKRAVFAQNMKKIADKKNASVISDMESRYKANRAKAGKSHYGRT